MSEDTQDAELLGFALYLRDSPEVITVVHVAAFDGIVTEEGSDPLLALRCSTASASLPAESAA